MSDEVRLVAIRETFMRGLRSQLRKDDPGREELLALWQDAITEEEGALAVAEVERGGNPTLAAKLRAAFNPEGEA